MRLILFFFLRKSICAAQNEFLPHNDIDVATKILKQKKAEKRSLQGGRKKELGNRLNLQRTGKEGLFLGLPLQLRRSLIASLASYLTALLVFYTSKYHDLKGRKEASELLNYA